jgi:hypothetical protein
MKRSRDEEDEVVASKEASLEDEAPSAKVSAVTAAEPVRVSSVVVVPQRQQQQQPQQQQPQKVSSKIVVASYNPVEGTKTQSTTRQKEAQGPLIPERVRKERGGAGRESLERGERKRVSGESETEFLFPSPPMVGCCIGQMFPLI